MKGSSYRERDYAFGQIMLTLRIKFGLTQIELADMLGVTRHAVIDWEGGLSYPSVDHLKHFVALAIECQVWSVGREAEEACALWQAAHQKVLLDDGWLGELLSQHTDLPSVPACRGDWCYGPIARLSVQERTTYRLERRARCGELLWARARTGAALGVDASRALSSRQCAGPG